MKVYEVGFKSNDDCVVWIATDRELDFKDVDHDMYCKLINAYSEETPGVDIVIT